MITLILYIFKKKEKKKVKNNQSKKNTSIYTMAHAVRHAMARVTSIDAPVGRLSKLLINRHRQKFNPS